MIDTLLHEKIAARLSHVAPAIPVGISNRHVHLAQQDVEALFGKGYVLTPFKPLRQPGQFAAQECVTVVGPKGSLTQVRVLGPTRRYRSWKSPAPTALPSASKRRFANPASWRTRAARC
ncbi:ethanolamine utilization protein [Klebsiella michiganensis]|nr:ethanolamine utilization protein [Klebsiella michiganensis]